MDFDGMSTIVGLFYYLRLGNFVSVGYKYFLNISI